MRYGRKSLMLLTALSVLSLSAVACAVPDDSPGDESSFYVGELESSGLLDRFGLSWDDTTSVAGSLNGYLLAALQDNQTLHRRFAEYMATSASVRQATSLPDPRLGYTEYLKSVETRVGPQQRAFSFSQSFPWFGSLSLQGDVREEKAAASRAVFHNAVLEVIADVKQAYYDLGYLEQAITVTGRHLQLLAQWEDIARVRYSAGSGQYTDVIKAQVELGVLSDRLAELQDQRQPTGAVLNALLNREATAPVPIERQLPPLGAEVSLTDLVARMKAANPLLTAWDHRAQEFLNVDQLVKKQGRPSFSLGVNYIQTGEARMDGVADSGQDALMASVAVTVPIWRGKYQAGSQVALNNYSAALSGKRELINKLNTNLERAHFGYRDARRKTALYESALLPKGRQSLGAIRSAYEAGKSGFLDLVDAERLVLEFELAQARAQFDVLIQEAALEELVAGPLAAAVTAMDQ